MNKMEMMNALKEHAKDNFEIRRKLMKEMKDEPMQSALGRYFDRLESERKKLFADLSKAGVRRPRVWTSVIISGVAAIAATVAAYYMSNRGPKETPA